MDIRHFRLSKSKLMAGLHCPKRLWLATHRPQAMQTSATTQHAFDQGHHFGEVARDVIGPGCLIGHPHNISLARTQTMLSLATHMRLFEPAFVRDGVVARLDCLEQAGTGYCMIEVKSAFSVKDHFLTDCAIQAWVAIGAGIAINKIVLAVINDAFVYQGDGNYFGLLAYHDVTLDVVERLSQVPQWVQSLRTVLSAQEPAIKTGRHCSVPYACPFIEHCQPHAHPPSPASDALDPLPRTRYAQGAGAMPRNGAQIFLHFDTVRLAVPAWKGTRAYQPVPIGWSCMKQSRHGTQWSETFVGRCAQTAASDLAQWLARLTEEGGPVAVRDTKAARSQLGWLAMTVPYCEAPLRALALRLVAAQSSAAGAATLLADPREEAKQEEAAQQAYTQIAYGTASAETMTALCEQLEHRLARKSRELAQLASC